MDPLESGSAARIDHPTAVCTIRSLNYIYWGIYCGYLHSISAKIPDGIGRDKIPEMVRNLLIDRFRLVCHTEQRTVKGFALILTDLHKLV
jgi:hypothetical protein